VKERAGSGIPFDGDAGVSVYYLGIDPGRSGASVLLREKSVVGIVAWRPVVRKKVKVYEVTSMIGSNKTTKIVNNMTTVSFITVAMMFALGAQEANVAIEEVYAGRNIRTSLQLAKMAGALIGPIEHKTSCSAKWVHAGEWRKIVFGLKRNTGREICKETSIRTIPYHIPSIQPFIDAIGLHDHITDAAGIAEWLRCTQGESGGKEKRGSGSNTGNI